MELRLCLFVQSRSASVHFTAGSISYKSAPVTPARVFAISAVTPLAEKYATSFFDIVTPCPLNIQQYKSTRRRRRFQCFLLPASEPEGEQRRVCKKKNAEFVLEAS